MVFRTASILSLGLATALTAASAGAAEPPRPASEGRTIGGAIAQPIRDLGLLREKIPVALAEAGQSPYSAPTDCSALEAEVERLNQALGPDVDSSEKAKGVHPGEALLAGAVRNAVGLPFRGVVRRVSGAEKRDAAFREAVMAGMVRRGYLKGARAQMSCDPAPAPVQAIAAEAPPPAADAFTTDVSDVAAEQPGILIPPVEQAPISIPPAEEVHDGGEVAQVHGLVEQGGADETLVGERAIAGGEDERDLLLR